MAQNNDDSNEAKSNYVVLYLLIVLLGLTLAVTVYVFSHPDDMFPAYNPKPFAPAPAVAVAETHGYDQVKKVSTGKLPIRYNLPMQVNGDVSLATGPGGARELTLRIANGSGILITPDSFTVNVHPHGKEDSDGFVPVFKNTARGTYVARPDFPAAGDWDVHVKIRHDDEQSKNTYEFTTTVNVPASVKK
ncbi:MAG: hypothetical protein GC185_01225 [Alphaproteobacteria bacterium]|nr:hypothetical protein [Alphaproteobacteria bacterium]